MRTQKVIDGIIDVIKSFALRHKATLVIGDGEIHIRLHSKSGRLTVQIMAFEKATLAGKIEPFIEITSMRTSGITIKKFAISDPVFNSEKVKSALEESIQF